MSRRRVDVISELPGNCRRLLNSIGVDLGDCQAWLNEHRTDGCTFAPDLYLVVCGWHDWACRASDIPRWICDGVAAVMIWRIAMQCEDEAPWRAFGCVLAVLFWIGARTVRLFGCVYCGIFWVGVRVGAVLGIGRRR